MWGHRCLDTERSAEWADEESEREGNLKKSSSTSTKVPHVCFTLLCQVLVQVQNSPCTQLYCHKIRYSYLIA